MRPQGKPVKSVALIKASHNPGVPVYLNMERIASNSARGIVTSFIPDANVVMRMEKAADPRLPATDETLAHYGLLEYINILRDCCRRDLGFSISPVFAFSEVLENKLELCLQRYNEFGKRFGIDWNDDPEAFANPIIGRQRVPSIWSLPSDQRTFMALNYAHQLLMLYIQHTGAARTSLQNFELYLYEVVNNIRRLSGRDIAVVSYLFADPNACEPELVDICSKVRENFGRHQDKIPRTLQAMDACALNSSYDLLLANLANWSDTRLLEGVKQDNWVVTGDEKLALFMSMCHNYNGGTTGAGQTVAATHHESGDGYLQAAQAKIKFLTETRVAHPPSMPGLEEMNSMLHRVTARVEKMLKEHEEERRASAILKRNEKTSRRSKPLDHSGVRPGA